MFLIKVSTAITWTIRHFSVWFSYLYFVYYQQKKLLFCPTYKYLRYGRLDINKDKFMQYTVTVLHMKPQGLSFNLKILQNPNIILLYDLLALNILS
jgi:hypothetical protein